MTDPVKKDISAIEKCNSLLVRAILIGEKFAKNGSDFSKDIVLLPEVEVLAKDIYSFVQSKPELVEEGKDIDFNEAIQLAKDLYDDFKQVTA